MAEYNGLYTTVRNISGRTRRFTFLPPHGRELANNETFTVIGDIHTAVIRGDRGESRRNLNALERALQGPVPTLEIVQTPSPILQDATTGETKMLRLNNGTLGVVSPTYAQSISSPSDT